MDQRTQPDARRLVHAIVAPSDAYSRGDLICTPAPISACLAAFTRWLLRAATAIRVILGGQVAAGPSDAGLVSGRLVAGIWCRQLEARRRPKVAWALAGLFGCGSVLDREVGQGVSWC